MSGRPEEDAALAALTTTPAQMLGVSDRIRTVDNGKMANLVITDKPYFNEKSKVRYVFVDGVMYKLDVKEAKKTDGAKAEIEGSWSSVIQTPQGSNDHKMVFKKEGTAYSGIVSGGMLTTPVDMKDVTLEGTALTFNYSIMINGSALKIEVEVAVDGDGFKGTATAGQFGSFPIEGTKDPKK